MRGLVAVGLFLLSGLALGAEPKPLFTISAEKLTFDDEGMPTVAYEATASKAVKKGGFIILNLRCRADGKTLKDWGKESVDAFEAGDTKKCESYVEAFKFKTPPEWCEASYVYEPDHKTKTPLYTSCWTKAKGFAAGKCKE